MKDFLYLFLAFFGTIISVDAQIAIGTNNPHSSAKLEVNSSDKGFLPPRVALSSLLDLSTISNPVTGLFVFNTATAGSGVVAVTPGYYYFDGTQWQRMVNHDKELTKVTLIVDNKQASSVGISGPANISNWSGNYTSSGGDITVRADFTCYSTSTGTFTTRLLRDGNVVVTQNQGFNSSQMHQYFKPLVYSKANDSGSHTYTIKIESNLVADFYDYCTITVIETNIP